jgi:hypothetical protein
VCEKSTILGRSENISIYDKSTTGAWNEECSLARGTKLGWEYRGNNACGTGPMRGNSILLWGDYDVVSGHGLGQLSVGEATEGLI